MKRFLAMFLVVLMAAATGILSACEEAVTLRAAQDEFHAELGESFLIPDPVVSGGNLSDVTFTVTDASGAEVTRAQLGSFYPEAGTYTITYRLNELTATATVECSDTKGPSVEYTDYVKLVFEEDLVTVPTFVASDISGVNDASKSLKVYADAAHTEEVTLGDGAFTAQVGAEAYYIVYRVKDSVGNETVTELPVRVRKNFVDAEIGENELWDFDEQEYLNLVSEPTVAGVKTPEYSIVKDFPGAEGTDGALKLSFSENNTYAGIRLLRGKIVNTGSVSRLIIRLYADNDISIFSVRSLREDLADVEFSDLEKNVWHELEINPRALHPDAVDLSELEISFRNTGTTNIYIDAIYAVPFFTDEELAEGVLGDFDEQGYLANIEQAGYDIGKGLISADYEIIPKESLPEGALRDGANGSVLKVTCNDLWESDYAGYGVLGDGVKYLLPQPMNTAEVSTLYLRIYCEEGADLALSFCYYAPDGSIQRSRARWLRGTLGGWQTIAVSYAQIIQIVPLHAITDDQGNQIIDFDLTAVVITSCGNIPDHTTPCKSFYLDEISYQMNFTDEELAEGVLGDFDERGYSAKIDQAWDTDTVTAEYEVLAAGAEGIPAGANGGVVKVRANRATTASETIPDQGIRGDGVRFYLFETLAFNDLNSLTIRIYGGADTGTELSVGFIINRAGQRIRSNALWQSCVSGSWSEIVLNKERLSLRLNAGDEILAVAVWASNNTGSNTACMEFYLDEIRYTLVDLNAPVYPENCLIDFLDANDALRVAQSTRAWPGNTTYGQATINLIARENEDNALIYGYQWFNTDAKKEAFRSFTGNVLEVVAAADRMDGAQVTFYQPLALSAASTLDIAMYSNTANGGYVFYVEDSAGNVKEFRIRVSTDTYAADGRYTLYEWSTVNLSVAAMQSAGLKDIARISFVYGSGSGNASYLYLKPITYTPAA